ncbi:VOC family protein [Streptomyces sp. AK02-01A]|uniref:VOC family protein n=1 Tax=Streptomyces sp. AK02-01A TaxID=3028648 RepID=UPI0029B994E0|nr:VOC family protein [Streptomyces sp. AK02-01A]MDX3851784.1 VOC family protein [Streptomyces sp. AK02-01A]
MAAFAEGTPCWVDVSLPDLAAGRRFYGELFGWTFGGDSDEAYGRCTKAFSDGKRVAGLVAKRDGRMPTVWGVYFATADAVALSRRITDAGGRLVREPIAVGRSGVTALAADPAGAVFGIWQGDEDTGFEKKGLPGSFCWTEVYTRDKERVDPFYETVFGFHGTDVPDDSVDFRMWSPAGTEPGPDSAVGGRSVITDAFPAEMPGHFLSYFSVADCDGTTATVVRLGGRITAPPFDIEYGRMAVVVDNQGASFAVLAEPRSAPRAAAESLSESGWRGLPEPGPASEP